MANHEDGPRAGARARGWTRADHHEDWPDAGAPPAAPTAVRRRTEETRADEAVDGPARPEAGRSRNGALGRLVVVDVATLGGCIAVDALLRLRMGAVSADSVPAGLALPVLLGSAAWIRTGVFGRASSARTIT